MKIGIDATFNPSGGSLGHLQEFIKELSITHSKLDLILYLKKENIELLGNSVINKCSLRIVPISSFGNILRILWGQFVLPLSAKIDKLDILFCPGNISPILKTTNIKAQWIATIGPFSKGFYSGFGLHYKFRDTINKYFILLSGLTSNIVIHESAYSKELFESKYNYHPNKQFLIECGKDNFYKPSYKSIESKNVISNISTKDLLCVSHLYPYKNIERLIGAFGSHKRNNNSDQKLYIAGKQPVAKYYLSLQNLVKKNHLEDYVIFTGMATKEELRYAYSQCKLFVFPSLCESSGYTLIEAMSCGSAILASDQTAIPNTCKDAAEYFSAYSEEDLTSKLKTLLSEGSKLTLMKSKSLVRASGMIDYKAATSEFVKIINNVSD